MCVYPSMGVSRLEEEHKLILHLNLHTIQIYQTLNEVKQAPSLFYQQTVYYMSLMLTKLVNSYIYITPTAIIEKNLLL